MVGLITHNMKMTSIVLGEHASRTAPIHVDRKRSSLVRLAPRGEDDQHVQGVQHVAPWLKTLNLQLNKGFENRLLIMIKVSNFFVAARPLVNWEDVCGF